LNIAELERPAKQAGELAPTRIALTIFETAEYLGLGEGFQPQITITDFPPGAVVKMEMAIPDDERWFWVLCLYGDTPSSAVTLKVEWEMPTVTKWHTRSLVIFFHEGWIGQMVCPFGLKAMREGSTVKATLANVTDETGDAELDRFVPFAQKVHGGPITVNLSGTLFMFRVYREYFERMDELVKRVFRLT